MCKKQHCISFELVYRLFYFEYILCNRENMINISVLFLILRWVRVGCVVDKNMGISCLKCVALGF